jgi:hypothetical protein
VLVPGQAWARGDGWQPLPTAPDSEVACPGGDVLVHVVMNKEYVKFSSLGDGTVLLMVTGQLKYRLTNERTGQTVVVVASGPSVGQHLGKAQPNGDFLFQAVGRNIGFLTPQQVAETGLPPIFVTSGPIRVLITTDGRLVPIQIPHHQTDYCAVLGLS